MDIFNELFQSLIFKKVRIVNGFAFYVANIQSLVGVEKKYIILIVPLQYSRNTFAKIFELNWISLQTRSLNESYDVEEQALDQTILDHRYDKNKYKLFVKARTEQNTEYYSNNLPIVVELLHNPRKKDLLGNISINQYADELELRQALNTFQCIIKKL